MESVENQILEIIGWYNDLPSDHLAISEIMDKRRKLSTLSASLAVEMGKARKKWKLAEFNSRSESNQKKIKLLNKMSATKADIFIKANPTTEDEKEVKWEIVFYQKDYLFKAVKEILSEMNQRVSYLREEEKTEKYYGNQD